MHCTLIPHWRWSLLLVAPFSSISLLAHLRLRVEADLPLHVDSFENCTLIENFIHMDYLYLDFVFLYLLGFRLRFVQLIIILNLFISLGSRITHGDS